MNFLSYTYIDNQDYISRILEITEISLLLITQI